jgi:hypothetical protein
MDPPHHGRGGGTAQKEVNGWHKATVYCLKGGGLKDVRLSAQKVLTRQRERKKKEDFEDGPGVYIFGKFPAYPEKVINRGNVI